jgi:hypothetical protein
MYTADSEIKVTCDDPAVFASIPTEMLPHLDKFQKYSNPSTTCNATSASASDSPSSVNLSTGSAHPVSASVPGQPLSSSTSAPASASAPRPQATRTVSNTVKLWLRGPRHDSPKWIYLKYNSTFSFHKVYHLEFYWISTSQHDL